MNAFKIFFLCFLSGCATTSALTTTYQTGVGAVQGLDVTLQAAVDGDGIYQQTVATDRTLTTAQRATKLTAYRASRSSGVAIVHQVQSVVDAGPPLLQLAVDGAKKQTDVDVWLGDLVAAAPKLSAALAAFGVGAAPSGEVHTAELDGSQIAAIVTASITGFGSLAGGIVSIVQAVRAMGTATTDQQASAFSASVQAFDTAVGALPQQLAANDARADATAASP